MRAAPFSPHGVSLALLSLIHHVLAVVQLSRPRAGATLTAGDPIDVTWEYTNLSDQLLPGGLQFDLALCAGGNGNGSQEQLATLIERGVLADSNSVSVNIDPGVGGEHRNAYFLRMVLDVNEWSLIIHSGRFTLTNMTGAFTASVSAALQSISGTDGPPSYEKLGKRQAAGGALGDVPYPDQTGVTRYAPVPKVPGSKISIESAKPRFPSSSYRIATALLPPPTVVTTVSPTPTQTATSIENTVAAAPGPADDMEKFLNRWKD